MRSTLSEFMKRIFAIVYRDSWSLDPSVCKKSGPWMEVYGARLRTWTSTAEPAQTDQAWAGLPQLLQRSLFAHLYRFSPAQASWCL